MAVRVTTRSTGSIFFIYDTTRYDLIGRINVRLKADGTCLIYRTELKKYNRPDMLGRKGKESEFPKSIPREEERGSMVERIYKRIGFKPRVEE